MAIRPRSIPVTDVDRLKADPYAFYAKRMLRLRPLDPVDADPSAAWRGTAVHDALEQWARHDGCDPDALEPRVLEMLRAAHPMMRALWQPRLIEAVRWIAGEVETDRAAGRAPRAAELFGKGLGWKIFLFIFPGLSHLILGFGSSPADRSMIAPGVGLNA